MGISFNRIADQGELRITRIAKLPQNAGQKVAPENGRLIVGRSETGHHHVIDAECGELTRVSDLLAYLNIKVATDLTHTRPYDTHKPVALQPGMYEIRTGREFDPFEKVIRASAD